MARSRSGKDCFRFVLLSGRKMSETQPHDSDISGALWLTIDEFQHYIQQPGNAARNPLVWQALQGLSCRKTFSIIGSTKF
ncbi:hypothetical protein INT80_06020 [Gallibacterium anatis]|uniref:Uncharacterized protein n=1 Tax=Gallibacterium anatis TaxID=750 RepID=A0A930URB1_9PAST|nr:hypothetical protein [Gallibacterium anatis]